MQPGTLHAGQQSASASPFAQPLHAQQPLHQPLQPHQGVLTQTADSVTLQTTSPKADTVPPAELTDPPTEAPSPLDPRHWNLRKAIPLVGTGVSLAWGVGNILEHMLHDGHGKVFANGQTGKLAAGLAKYLPLVNIGYGAVNTAGAFLNGYGMRTVAFGSYTLASTLAAPLLLKGNARYAQLLNEARAKGFHEVKDALKDPAFQAWFHQHMPKDALALKKFHALFNATAPIGLLMGLFTITKVAQSTKGLDLQHPTGDTLAQLQDPNHPGPKPHTALVHNIRQELGAFGKTLANFPSSIAGSLQGWGKGLHRLQHPTPPHKCPEDGETHQRSLGQMWKDFAHPIMESPFTGFTYALTGLGRMMSAGFALTMAAQGGMSLLTKGNLITQLEKAPKPPAPVNAKLMNAIGTTFLAGQFAGAVSALFTRFNDWNPVLSSFYRISAVPYALSGISALNRSFKPLGLGAEDLAKFGAFIQATSYFVNLLVKKDEPKADHGGEKPAPTPPAHVHPTLLAAPIGAAALATRLPTPLPAMADAPVSPALNRQQLVRNALNAPRQQTAQGLPTIHHSDVIKTIEAAVPYIT